MIQDLTTMWTSIFSLANSDVDFKKPLTKKILSNPDHKIVKTLVYIYSMESFVFSEMNRASRTKDISKIKYYGALASALGFIIHCGNNSSPNREFKAYRGLQLSKDGFNQQFKEG